jgi:hypothetical protein
MTEYARRLSDKILFAFNQACDQGYHDVAEILLRGLELALTRQGGRGNVDHRQNLQAVTDAYTRLQSLKQLQGAAD